MLELPCKGVEDQTEDFERNDPQLRRIVRLAENDRRVCFAQLGNPNKALRHLPLFGCAVRKLKPLSAFAFQFQRLPSSVGQESVAGPTVYQETNARRVAGRGRAGAGSGTPRRAGVIAIG